MDQQPTVLLNPAGRALHAPPTGSVADPGAGHALFQWGPAPPEFPPSFSDYTAARMRFAASQRRLAADTLDDGTS